MERVGFSDQVVDAFREAGRGTGWGEARYTVGARRRGGSWFDLIAALLGAFLVGGLTTWGVVAVWPELSFPPVMGLSIGYLVTLGLLSAAYAKRPGNRYPATWVVVWEEGMGWMPEGGTPVVLAWDEIAEARHTVTSVRDGFGKEFNRTHRLMVVPVADPVHRGRLFLEPDFPSVEEIAIFVAARARAT
ncbi:hypothetical protein ACF07T_14980 [Streptomyces sp. NPDC015184]|uniref:hypothetical protein n=1 Tax=Streptomyces sp. NPDC015184 TaxID=3364946 RepID=UPI0037028590